MCLKLEWKTFKGECFAQCIILVVCFYQKVKERREITFSGATESLDRMMHQQQAEAV